MKKFLHNLVTVLASVAVSVLAVATIARAGTLAPSLSPAATSYTLGDIYTRLTTNAAATAGGHSFAPGGSPVGTLHSLTDIYSAIPTIASTMVDVGTSYLGVSGTLLANMYNGTCSNPETCPMGTEAPGGSQANGGVDDYNGNNQGYAPPSDRYATTWTSCTSGNDYCGTGDTGASAEDTATDLIWSYPCQDTSSTVGCASWDTSDSSTTDVMGCQDVGCNYYNTDTYYTWDDTGTDNNNLTAQQLCSQYSGWSLPSQKQLMQAYIDGSYGNLEPVGVNRYYWSSTLFSDSPSDVAWYVGLSQGVVDSDVVSDQDFLVRCVRQAM